MKNYGKLIKKERPKRLLRHFLTVTLLASFTVANAIDKPVDRTPPVGYDPAATVAKADSESRTAVSVPKQLQFPRNSVLGDVDEIRDALDDTTLVTPSDGGPTVPVLITLRPAGSNTSVAARQGQIPALEAALDGTGSRIAQRWQHFPVVLAHVNQVGLDLLLQTEAVGGLELDRVNEAYLTSSRPVIGVDDVNAAGHEGGGSRTNDVWEVAIIDTGVLSTHEAFPGKVVAEACYNTTTTCPNGATSMVGTGAGAPCGISGCDHGTHVAGIAAGVAASGEPGGNAPDSNIVAINVFQNVPGFGLGAYNSSIISGLDFVYNRATVDLERVASVNLSLGGGNYAGTCDTVSPAMTTSMSQLRSAGVMVVAATGNSYYLSTMGSPACISHAVAVGNTYDNDTIRESSNASTAMDLWAPGSLITAPVTSSNSSYGSKSGTSMSSPQVAGAAAVLYDCEAGYSGAGNVPAGSSYDDWVLGKMTSNGVSVTDNRAGGTVTKPRLDLAAAADDYFGNSNDDFASPITLGGVSGSVSDFTHCADLQAGESPPIGVSNGSKWFQWTAPADGTVEFTTCDAQTTADTVLAVYKGSTLGSIVLDGYDDDDFSCAHFHNQSTYTANVASGEDIRVSVLAFSNVNTRQGLYTLSYDFTAAGASCNGLPITVDIGAGDLPTNGNDVILGTTGADNINGLDGDDTICGLAGDDLLTGGRGNDTIYGNEGLDTIYAGTGLDTVYGNEDNDAIYGQGGVDQLNGGAGVDYIYGGSGADVISGGTGDDFLYGYGSGDTINGNNGADSINGGPGPDVINGGADADTINGQGGADTLNGQAGDDTIKGGSGPDTVNGGADYDLCNGQAGNDTESNCEVATSFPSPPATVVLPPNLVGITSVDDIDAIDLCDDTIEQCLAQ